MTTNLGETFRLALAALRSTVGDAKFREIEKTWVQEHQEQTVTTAEFVKFASGKSTKAIDPTDEAVTYHYDFAKPSGAAKITVTYDGQTASFTVKVTADAGNKTGNNPKQQASPVQNGNTSTQPNGVSNPLSKTGASTAPIITLAALTLLTGGVNADTVWLFAAWLRRERSLWGNAVAVLATSMMTVVIASFGDRLPPLCGAGGGQVSCDAVAQYRQGIRALPDWRSWTDVQAWWPAYSAPKAALTAAIVFALTQYGSVLFVKTMIREYGKRSYLVASWVWHAALAITGFAVNMWLGVVAVVLLTRSVAIPLRFRGQRETDDRRRHRSDVPATGVHSGHHHLSSPGIAAIRLPLPIRLPPRP